MNSSQDPGELVSIRREIADMARQLLDVVGVPFEQTSELERQVLGAFAFGMNFAVGQFKGLSPPDVQALTTCCLIDVFQYAAYQAGAFSSVLIHAASNEDPENTMKAIIHRGIDGHYQWQEGQLDGLKENIRGIFKALRR